MKKFKTGLLALVLFAGVSAAVASHVHAAPKPADSVYNWTQSGSNPFTGTVNQAMQHYGCPTLAVGCAHGTLAPGSSGPPTADIQH